MTLEQYTDLLKTLEADANSEVTAFMSHDFERIIKGTLQLLASRETAPKVVDIACSLATNHAFQSYNFL